MSKSIDIYIMMQYDKDSDADLFEHYSSLSLLLASCDQPLQMEMTKGKRYRLCVEEVVEVEVPKIYVIRHIKTGKAFVKKDGDGTITWGDENETVCRFNTVDSAKSFAESVGIAEEYAISEV